jgi:deoxyribonuclease V
VEPTLNHRWDLSPAEARALQTELAPRVICSGDPTEVTTVAGADISAGRFGSNARGAVVLLDYPSLTALEQHIVETTTPFPYVPGLLSFREIPVLSQAFARLSRRPDLLVVDGQGYAHPRRFGLACHLGLAFDLPTIGCAKSRLVGVHAPLGEEVGAMADLVDGGEVIGRVVRTRTGSKPLYVSVGHRIGLDEACDWIFRLGAGYRLPEPTRLADRAAARKRSPISLLE